MRIAVIEHAEGGDYSEYIFSLIEENARQHDYQIKTWSNSVPAFQQQVPENAVIILSAGSSSAFMLKWLYSVKFPSILKKVRADIVVNLNGIASPKIKIPQTIAIGQPFFYNNAKYHAGVEKFALANFNHSLKFAKNSLLYSAEKSNALPSEKEKAETFFFTAPAAFKTFEWHEKILVKAQHADNKEFFISVIEDDDVECFVLLLQAYSKFKKWQQSSMQLLVLPKYERFSAAIRARHTTYKYKDDVQLLEAVEEKQIAEIFASAYALIHVAGVYAQLLVISIAMKCSLPVISLEDDDVKEYAGAAALFSIEKNASALGNILIELYKDENLHARLKEAAKKQAENLSSNTHAEKLWQLLEAQIKNNNY